MAAKEKIPSKKNIAVGNFLRRCEVKDMDNVLDIRAEEALAALFQPDTVAPAEYLIIYERKTGLEPEKKLMLVVLEDAIGCFQNFVCATDNNRQKKWLLEAEEWFNEKKGEDVCVSLPKTAASVNRATHCSWHSNVRHPPAG
jgi:hypothetical protein